MKREVLFIHYEVDTGGTPHMKGVGMLVRNFEPLKETDLGVAQALFDL